MVHEIAPFGVEDLSIWFYFDAEIVRKEEANGDTFELCDKVRHRGLCVDHCDCSTGELYILTRDLPTADAELERYLNENTPIMSLAILKSRAIASDLNERDTP